MQFHGGNQKWVKNDYQTNLAQGKPPDLVLWGSLLSRRQISIPASLPSEAVN